MRPSKSDRLAHGFLGGRTALTGFTDGVKGFPLYLKGMKLWIRRWDGRPVLGGMYFFLYVHVQGVPRGISRLYGPCGGAQASNLSLKLPI